jgi:hypothetical protein
MNEWRTMAAGRELDRVIAEKAGGTVYQMSEVDYWHSPASSGGDRWEVRHRDGRAEALPPYSTSVDAALTLIPESELGAEMIKGTDSWTVKMVFREGVFKGVANNVDQLALAICRAWLAWQEAQG